MFPYKIPALVQSYCTILACGSFNKIHRRYPNIVITWKCKVICKIILLQNRQKTYRWLRNLINALVDNIVYYVKTFIFSDSSTCVHTCEVFLSHVMLEENKIRRLEYAPFIRIWFKLFNQNIIIQDINNVTNMLITENRSELVITERRDTRRTTYDTPHWTTKSPPY